MAINNSDYFVKIYYKSWLVQTSYKKKIMFLYLKYR